MCVNLARRSVTRRAGPVPCLGDGDNDVYERSSRHVGYSVSPGGYTRAEGTEPGDAGRRAVFARAWKVQVCAENKLLQFLSYLSTFYQYNLFFNLKFVFCGSQN